MLDAWLNRTRDWLAPAEKLLALPEQQTALWMVNRALQSSAVNPPLVYLWGDAGAGKTSIARHALRQQPKSRRNHLCTATAEEWCRELSVLETSGESLNLADNLDVVLCEDLQDLSDPHEEGERLARWLDQARSEGLVVMVTSDRLPSQIEGLSPRLMSRLRGGLFAGIRPLGNESRRRLSRFWTAERNLDTRPTEIPAALLTAGQVKNYLTRDSSPTEPIAGDVTLVSAENSLDLIAEVVAQNFQISLTELCSGSRTQQLKVPRGVAMQLARELTPCSLLKIGHYFGCRSHTSVVRSCTRLQELLPEAPSLREQIQLLRAKLRHNLSADCG